jgi:hypothetical protein
MIMRWSDFDRGLDVHDGLRDLWNEANRLLAEVGAFRRRLEADVKEAVAADEHGRARILEEILGVLAEDQRITE